LPHPAIDLSGLALLAWLYLAFLHGGFWKPLQDERAAEPAAWPSVDVVVPARNEADVLPQSLPSLLAQDYPGTWKILLVDDHSNDGTADVARRHAANHRVTIVVPPALPDGWSGKVAAMNAGVVRSTAEYILFTDADIEHPADSLRRLAARAIERNLDLTSRMVRLHCESFAEKLLVPAFVFFFAMLYPFRRANNPASRVAAAAGGVMLVRRQTLDAIGGLARIKSALIDDCALARAIKDRGAKIELTLADDIKSLRRYPELANIHAMVARTAYTQLHYSPLLLAGTCLGMALLFLVPPLFLISGHELAGLALVILFSVYLPTVRFYSLPAVWVLTLPAAATFYVFATLDSARLHWQGRGGQWKGRKQTA
jgi:hopene-associated glycosyltransferase HpnB